MYIPRTAEFYYMTINNETECLVTFYTYYSVEKLLDNFLSFKYLSILKPAVYFPFEQN